jgi:alpha-L-fucosidase
MSDFRPDRRQFAIGTAAAVLTRGTGQAQSPETGPFQANWESLAGRYQAPDWYRDAKFGIWAHWSAQCVPEQGDWYARNMYMQGSPHNQYHVANYGHPAEFGFMNINRLWTADAWEPETLIRRYAAAGAKYFVSLANHHDNFDNYNSRHHPWNAVNVGPRRDIVGTWARAARAVGLKFGVSNHSSHAWHWFQVAYGYDAEGSRAGQRYDAYRLTKADGAGKWWEGLDPQTLYTGRHLVVPDGLTSVEAMNAWHGANDRKWFETPPPEGDFGETWKLRCLDLIDSYRPDLLYFDDTSLPFGQIGLDIAAHYYNSSLKWSGGSAMGVINAKGLPEEHKSALVEDHERGGVGAVTPHPFQTDTCIGDWHYRRSLFENHRYKTVMTVVHTLIDTIAKNGNLLLSIPVRGNGTIDEDEIKFLDGLTPWMEINGDAIYGTRPWRISGEGPTQVQTGAFNENRNVFTARDIRFTTKGTTLYAFALGSPDDGVVRIASLALGASGARRVTKAELLGAGPATFAQDASGLSLIIPESKRGGFAYAFRLPEIV